MSTERIKLAIGGRHWTDDGFVMFANSIAGIGGVVRVLVDPAMGVAYIDYDPSMACPSCLARAIKELRCIAGQPTGRGDCA